MNWEDAYKMPFSYIPGCKTTIFTDNNVTAFRILDTDLEFDIIDEILRRINNQPPKLLLPPGEFCVSKENSTTILFDGEEFISIAGFEYITGIGGLNLPKYVAEYIQNSFAEYICERLNLKIEMYTSYFANIKNLPENFCPISIAGKPINGWNGKQYKALAPKYQTWLDHKNGGSDENYTTEYIETVLSKTTRERVISDLLTLADGKIPCLICYEAPGKFCHRKLVAGWLQSKKVTITEY